jgi:hypothetical protein
MSVEERKEYVGWWINEAVELGVINNSLTWAMSYIIFNFSRHQRHGKVPRYICINLV